MSCKKKKVGLSQKEKDAYMLYVSILDEKRNRWGVTQKDIHSEVAEKMGWEHWKTSERCVKNAAKHHFIPSLLEIQEYYEKLDSSGNYVRKYHKRKQEEA